MFKITVGEYILSVHCGALPERYNRERQRAALAEEFGINSADGEACLLTASRHDGPPHLVVAQRFNPCGGCFDPALLVVPETGILFLGAGERLLAYRLD